MSSLLMTSIAVAASAVGEIVLMIGVGAFATRLQLISSASCEVLSSTAVRILFPCLAFSLFEAFSLQRIIRSIAVPAFAVVHIILGYGLGHLCARLCRVRPPYRPLVATMTAVGNGGTIPLVLVNSIARRWQLVADDPSAVDEANAAVGLYLLVWFILVFGPIQSHLRSCIRSSAYSSCSDSGNAKPSVMPPPRVHAPFSFYRLLTAMRPAVWAMAREPVVICCAAGLVIGIIKPLRQLLGRDGSLALVGNAATQLGTSANVVNLLVLGVTLLGVGVPGVPTPWRPPHLRRRLTRRKSAQLRQSVQAALGGSSQPMSPPTTTTHDHPMWTLGRGSCSPPSCNSSRSASPSDSKSSTVPNSLAGSTDDLRRLHQSATESATGAAVGRDSLRPPSPLRVLATRGRTLTRLAAPSTDVGIMEAARAPAPAISTRAPSQREEDTPSPVLSVPMPPEGSTPDVSRLLAIVCTVRLLILPALCAPLHALAASHGLLPRHPMVLVALNIEACVPTAPMLASFMSVGRAPRTLSEAVSRVFLGIYVCAVPMMALWICASTWVIEAGLTPTVLNASSMSSL